MCADPIYKKDIRRAVIKEVYVGEMCFQLMVRNKSNISIKVVSQTDEPVIMGSRLPNIGQVNYDYSRIRLADFTYI